VSNWFQRVENLLNAISTKADKIMATEQNLQDDLDAIKTGVANLAAEIAALKAAGAGAVTQAQLDSLDAEAKSIVTATGSGA
jgi:phage shock protein A